MVVCRQRRRALEDKNIIPNVKFGKTRNLVWGCISIKEVEDLFFVENIMDAKKYLYIYQEPFSTKCKQNFCKLTEIGS